MQASLVFSLYFLRFSLSALGSPVVPALGSQLEARDGSAALKVVAAHFIVGNAYPYSYDNWVSDINLAGSRGVDAFALNVGNEVWESDRMDDAYAAALTTVDNSTDTPSFGMFLSLDMTSLSCADDNDATTLAKLVQRYAGHPAQLRNNGRVVLSTFEGDGCGFGSAGWEKVVDGLNVWFVPVFFGEIASWSQWGVVDGAFNWNSGWPSGDQNVTWDSDAWWISQMPSGKSYVAAASPWFFTHYGPDTYNKNWIYRGDDWLLAMRWELIVAHRDQIDMVEIISWNDFGESHYVGPIEGAQPMSEAWTNGFDHQGWLDMMSYYIQAFKTGIYPTVGQDQIFMWARLAPANATASADNVGQPDNWQWTKDYAWAVAFLKSPANVTLTCGTSTATFSLQGGASKIKLPLVDSCSITANVMRAGALVSAFSPEGLAFNSSQPETYNFNAIVTVSPGF